MIASYFAIKNVQSSLCVILSYLLFPYLFVKCLYLGTDLLRFSKSYRICVNYLNYSLKNSSLLT